MDRATKLLLRARGSFAPRNQSYQDVLEGQEHDNTDIQFRSPQLNNNQESPGVASFIQYDDDQQHFQEESAVKPVSMEGSLSNQQPNRDSALPIHESEYTANKDAEISIPSYKYKFEDLPVTRLYASMTAISVIEVLSEIFANLFENELIPQAYDSMNKATSNHDTVGQILYQLDTRLFQDFLDKVLVDLRDIIDINVANNELCYQLKSIAVTKEELSQQLVDIRERLHKLNYQGEVHQNKNEFDKLNNKLQLNTQLNELTDAILNEDVSFEMAKK